jgi:hypothetical protein
MASRMARSTDPLRGREPEISVTWQQVCGWRLAQQHVTSPGSDLRTVTAALGGVQAQVTSSAQFTLRLRSPATADDIGTALWADRRLVKTWAMRGTLHWLPADEYPLWIAALRTREWRITPGWEKYHGVSKAQLHAITDAIPAALDGQQLTRDELADRLADVTGTAEIREQLRSGWGAVLKPAANRGLLCFGPDRGRNVTFVRPEEWLGGLTREPDADEALRAVLHRFLDAYGPATSADFARWFGITEKPARQLLTAHADELVAAAAEGASGWVTREGAEALASAPAADGVVLLGEFDPYVLAPISHRDAIIPAAHVNDVSRTAGWISAVVLIDGFVAGTWTTEQTADGTQIAVQPFAPMGPEAAGELAERAATFDERGLLPGAVTVRIADAMA